MKSRTQRLIDLERKRRFTEKFYLEAMQRLGLEASPEDLVQEWDDEDEAPDPLAELEAWILERRDELLMMLDKLDDASWATINGARDELAVVMSKIAELKAAYSMGESQAHDQGSNEQGEN
jgi:hypothetical protein